MNTALQAKRDRRGWLAAPAAIVLLALFVYPFLYGLFISFKPMEGGPFWANYAHFFSTATDWGTLWITFKLAAPATLINLGMAVPVAFALRRPSRMQRVVTTLLVVPITLGTVLIADSPMGELFVRLGGSFAPGDRVRLHIPPDRTLAYAEAP